jgi:hypothetical protein
MLDPGYRVRRPVLDDAPALLALIVASDVDEFGEPEGRALAEMRDEWQSSDLDSDLWLVEAPGGELAG